MTIATPEIKVYFGTVAAGGAFFTLNSATKGVLDGATYVLGGDIGTDVDVDGYALSIRRGRSRELDEFETGTCTGSLYNYDRVYDSTNAASPLFGQVVPGRRVTVAVWDQTIFDGLIEDWDLDWDVSLQASVSFTAEDGLGQLARREFDAWTATAAQTAGPRIDDSLNRSEVNFGINRNLDTGVTSLQGDNVTWSSNVLNYLQLVAKSDAGRLFVTRDGTLRYQDRRSLVNPTSTVAFDDTGVGIPFHGVTTAAGSNLLYNRVGVDREDGTLQTESDQTSQDTYGLRSLSLPGLLMDSDSQADDMAAWMLNLYKDPDVRIASVMVKVHTLESPTARADVTRLDIGDVVTVSWTPQRVGAPLSQLLVIEGIEHQLSADGDHVMTLNTSLALQVSSFILDDAMLGKLDTGGRLVF